MRSEDGRWHRVWHRVWGTDGYVLDLVGEDDELVVTMEVGAPGDKWPHLTGYPFVHITEYRFDGVE